jgi:hypothetical protein
MPRKDALDAEAMSQLMEELPRLIQQRDAAGIRYLAVASELQRHDAAWDKYDADIQAILDQLPKDEADLVEEKAKKPKPWG